MRLLIFTPEVDLDSDVRGFVHGWIKAFAALHESITVVALTVGRLELPANVHVVSLQHGTSRLKTLSRFYLKTIPLLFRSRAEGVLVHMAPVFAILVGPLTRTLRIPLVMWYAHGSISWKLKIAHFFSNRVVTASEESFRLSSLKKRVVGHGIDFTMFPAFVPEGGHEGFLRILTIGRLSPSKDIPTVLKAIAQLSPETQRHISFQIIGAPFRESARDVQFVRELRTLVETLGLSAVVDFHEAVPHFEIPSYLNRCDLFINPSLTGSLDKSGLEAMAMAKPILTCNEAYLSLLGEYRQNLFFERKNIDALSDALNRFIRLSTVERAMIGEQLRLRTVKAHDLKTLVQRISAVFSELVSRA